MAYISTIPKATDVKSQSQSQILGNFAALAPFGNGFADFTVQGATPAITAGDTGLYTKSNATTTQNEMYIQKRTNNADAQVPMTASSISNAAATTNMVGWTYLPSGILIKWGNVNISAANTLNTVNIDSVSGGPVYSKVFNVQVTPYNTTTSTASSAAILSQFSTPWVGGTNIGMWVNCSGSGWSTGVVGIQYLAIGV